MATNMHTRHRPVKLRVPALAADRTGSFARRRVAILGLAMLAVAVVVSGWFSQPSTPTAALQQDVSDSLVQDAPNAPTTLLTTSVNIEGDLNMEFPLRDRGIARANRAAALDDVLAMTRAAYEADPRLLNVTLIGVWRTSPSASDLPVLYASMPADRLVGRDWTAVRADDLEKLGVVRWLPAGICQAWDDCGAGIGSPPALRYRGQSPRPNTFSTLG